MITSHSCSQYNGSISDKERKSQLFMLIILNIKYDGSYNNGSCNELGKLNHENGNIKFDGSYNNGSYSGLVKIYQRVYLLLKVKDNK